MEPPFWHIYVIMAAKIIFKLDLSLSVHVSAHCFGVTSPCLCDTFPKFGDLFSHRALIKVVLLNLKQVSCDSSGNLLRNRQKRTFDLILSLLGVNNGLTIWLLAAMIYIHLKSWRTDGGLGNGAKKSAIIHAFYLFWEITTEETGYDMIQVCGLFDRPSYTVSLLERTMYLLETSCWLVCGPRLRYRMIYRYLSNHGKMTFWWVSASANALESRLSCTNPSIFSVSHVISRQLLCARLCDGCIIISLQIHVI